MNLRILQKEIINFFIPLNVIFLSSFIIDIMDHLNQNSTKTSAFLSKGIFYVLGTTTIITTPWGY